MCCSIRAAGDAAAVAAACDARRSANVFDTSLPAASDAGASVAAVAAPAFFDGFAVSVAAGLEFDFLSVGAGAVVSIIHHIRK